jgi:hypothetical protein
MVNCERADRPQAALRIGEDAGRGGCAIPRCQREARHDDDETAFDGRSPPLPRLSARTRRPSPARTCRLDQLALSARRWRALPGGAKKRHISLVDRLKPGTCQPIRRCSGRCIACEGIGDAAQILSPGEQAHPKALSAQLADSPSRGASPLEASCRAICQSSALCFTKHRSDQAKA